MTSSNTGPSIMLLQDLIYNIVMLMINFQEYKCKNSLNTKSQGMVKFRNS